MGNNKYKLLIVEDEANIRSFIKANLETSDYKYNIVCRAVKNRRLFLPKNS